MNANTPSTNLQNELINNVYARNQYTFLFGKDRDGRLLCLHPFYDKLDVLQFRFVTDREVWTEQNFPHSVLVRSSDGEQDSAFCLFEPSSARIISDSVSPADDISRIEFMKCLALIASPKDKRSNGLRPIWSFKSYWNGKSMGAFLSTDLNHTALVQLELQDIAAKEPCYVNTPSF